MTTAKRLMIDGAPTPPGAGIEGLASERGAEEQAVAGGGLVDRGELAMTEETNKPLPGRALRSGRAHLAAYPYAAPSGQLTRDDLMLAHAQFGERGVPGDASIGIADGGRTLVATWNPNPVRVDDQPESGGGADELQQVVEVLESSAQEEAS